jgi:hypothetical protein
MKTSLRYKRDGMNVYQIPPKDDNLKWWKTLEFETWLSYQGEEFRSIINNKLSKRIAKYEQKTRK